MANPDRAVTPAVPQATIAAYATTALGIAVLSAAVNILPQLYAKELGIGLAEIGIALFLIRIFDAMSDQIVGFLSDRTRSRFGARKPWVIAGTAVTLLASYFLFVPSPGVGVVYFVVWRLAYDVGWTMVAVPYQAWGAELSSNYADRTRINGFSGFATTFGMLLKNVAPIALFWFGVTRNSAFSMEQFGYLFWICLIAVPVLTATSVIGAPSGEATTGQRADLRGMIRSIRGNRPFWFYLVAFSLTSLGQGMLGLLFTFYDSYLKVGQWYPYMMIGLGAVQMLAIPVWVRLSNVMGKHRAYAAAMVINVVAIQAFWFIDPDAMAPQTVAILGALVLLVVAFGGSCGYVAPAAMLADVVDYGAWKSGESRAGSYFAFHGLITKVTMALGSGLGFILLGAFSYSVKEGAVNSAFSNFGLLLTVVLLPAVLKGLGALILLKFPLTRKRHDILRRRLSRRGARGGYAIAVKVAPHGATAEGGAT